MKLGPINSALQQVGIDTATGLKHISRIGFDCDGKVHGDLPPGRGVVKFLPYLQAIKELNIDGTISIELEYAPDPAHIVAWVEEAYRETARLMDMVELRS
jgi:sugar phosphate isomerase/epimerase